MANSGKIVKRSGGGATANAMRRLAIAAAQQAVSGMVPHGGTIIKGAKAGYKLWKATKRTAPQAGSNKRRKVVEKNLETQIAGGHGITAYKKVIGRKLTKLPLSVRMQKQAIRNAREIYDQGNATSTVNKQAFATLHTLMDYNDFVAIMGTNAPDQSRKLFIEAMVTTIEFTNITNSPCELTLYQHCATQGATSSDNPADRFKEGMDRKFGDAANVELKMFHGPHESGTLKKFYRTTYAKKAILSPGECVSFKIYNNINRTIQNDAFQNASNTDFYYFAKSWTHAHSIMLRGFTVFEEVSGEGGRGVYSPAKVCWTAHKRIIFRSWDSGVPAASFYTTNDLAPVTGALKEIVQETGAAVGIGNL